MKVRFLHCGDTHLGCYPNRIEERFADFFNVFFEMIDYGVKNEIKLILISGDLFHLKTINSKTLLKTIEALTYAKANNIEVIVIEGNHDRAFFIDEDSWLNFLNEQGYIKLLGEPIIDGQVILSPYKNKKGSIIETKDYRIIGISYLGGMTEKYIKDLKKKIKKQDQFTILMLHAAVDRLQGQEMGDIRSEVILELKDIIDYVALGHIHVKYIIDDFCYNPGSLENIRIRDGRRSEEKGFFDVTVLENNSKEVKYVNSNPRKVHFHSIDISNLNKPEDLRKHIQDLNLNIKAGEMLELYLYGTPKFNPYLIEIYDLEAYLKQQYKLLHIEIKSSYTSLDIEKDGDEVVDQQTMIKKLVEQKLEYNYPDIKEASEITKTMLRVSEMINDGIDEDVIIEALYKQEVKL